MSRSLLSRVRDQQPISLARLSLALRSRDSLPLSSLARSAWPLGVRDKARLLSFSRVLHLKPSSLASSARPFESFEPWRKAEREREREREREGERREEEVILIVSFGQRALGGPSRVRRRRRYCRRRSAGPIRSSGRSVGASCVCLPVASGHAPPALLPDCEHKLTRHPISGMRSSHFVVG